MAETAERRAAPAGPLARGAIASSCSAPNYGPATIRSPPRNAPDRGAISLYARQRDYHEVIKGRLKQLAAFLLARAGAGEVKVFVDTAPVMEKPLAQAAGLGWQGKHTNLVSRAVRLLAVSRRDLHRSRRCRPTRRRAIIAAPAANVSTSARRTLFRRPISSMRAAASLISPSSTRGRSRASSAPRSAIACSAATIASPSAPGTNSPRRSRRGEARSARPSWTPRRSPISPRSTTPAFARCSPDARQAARPCALPAQCGDRHRQFSGEPRSGGGACARCSPPVAAGARRRGLGAGPSFAARGISTLAERQARASETDAGSLRGMGKRDTVRRKNDAALASPQRNRALLHGFVRTASVSSGLDRNHRRPPPMSNFIATHHG